jgi:glucose/arabinose dehydrogenase
MNKRSCYGPLALALGALLAGCSGKATIDPAQQSGSNPPLPSPKDFLLPPKKVPTGTGWQPGQSPKVAAGLKIEKIADGLKHPRQLLALPNGDVLVVESNGPGEEPVTTPKQLIANKVKGASGKGGKGGNRITLLRPKPGGNWEQHVLIEHLHSPFGVQLIGETLYIANTGAIVKFPYHVGETRITAPGAEFTDLPSTVNHDGTKALLASPDGKKLYVGVGSNSNITENGMDIVYRRADVLEVDAASASMRLACAIRQDCSGSPRAASSGPSSTNATRSARTWCRTT